MQTPLRSPFEPSAKVFLSQSGNISMHAPPVAVSGRANTKSPIFRRNCNATLAGRRLDIHMTKTDETDQIYAID